MDTEEEQHKDIFTHFGMAAYWVQCLETTLTNILLFDSRLDGKAPTSDDLETLEAALQKNKTMGGLIKEVRIKVGLPEQIDQIINESLVKRNFLIHHFFRERAFEFATTIGRQKMVTELREIQAGMKAADAMADTLCMGLAKKLGISAHLVDVESQRMREEATRRSECGSQG